MKKHEHKPFTKKHKSHKHAPHKHTAHEHAPHKHTVHMHTDKGKRNIVFLPLTDDRSASSRIRVYHNARALRKLGWHCSIGAKHDPQSAPFVVFQKRYRVDDRRLAQSCKGKVIFDMSESYWLKGQKEALKEMGKIAAVVTTSTGRQIQWWKKNGIKAVNIPNGFDFSEVPNVPKREKLTFCWIGNVLNERNLGILVNPLNRLYREIPFDFWVITGGDANIPEFSFPVRLIPWTRQTAFHYVAQCHIGVSPRILDNWNLAKSSYKVVAYMALGLATIATPIFSIRGIIIDGKNGFLVGNNDPEEWYAKLRTLAAEKDLRESMAKAGQQSAKAFDINVIAQQWSKLFRGL